MVINIKNSANNKYYGYGAALQWVKNNISNFGVNPNNVTIFVHLVVAQK